MRIFTLSMVFLALVCGLSAGFTMMAPFGEGSLCGISAAVADQAVVAPAEPQAAGASLAAPKNWVFRWGIFLAVLAAIWFLFYTIVYPYIVQYYAFDYADSLFWTMSVLYSLGWISFSLYVVFGVWEVWPWARWVSLFLSGLWLIWFLAVIFRSDVYHKY
ncbi:MAG: hypothetical protein HZB23_09245 [Deltaproteobacteria bacterium]|nr:hypothetical protein [Deltaproteobacteria bacterium]